VFLYNAVIVAELIPGNAAAFGLKVRSSNNGKRAITIRYADEVLNVGGTEMPMKLGKQTKTLKLHILLDRGLTSGGFHGRQKT